MGLGVAVVVAAPTWMKPFLTSRRTMRLRAVMAVPQTVPPLRPQSMCRGPVIAVR